MNLQETFSTGGRLRFPWRPEKRYISTQKRLPLGATAVTISAGFRCQDGVVLGADTEMTVPGWIKYPGTKISLYLELKHKPAFTFAGQERFCKMFIGQLVRRIVQAEQKGIKVLADLENELREESLSIHRMYSGESYEEESSLIVSLFLDWEGKKKRYLYTISQGVFAVEQSVCCGTGMGITQSMIAELFSPKMHISQVALLVAYLIAEAKTYAYGCGKESQILLLHDDGECAPFPEDPLYTDLGEIEEDYIDLKRKLRPIIRAYSDLSIKEDDFSKILDEFKRDVMIRKQQRTNIYRVLNQAKFEAESKYIDEEIERAEKRNKKGTP